MPNAKARAAARELPPCPRCGGATEPYDDDPLHDRWCDTCAIGFRKPAPAAAVADEEPEPKLTWRTVPVTDALMEGLGGRGATVMIHKDSRWGVRNTHNVVRRGDDGRWYVRQGKRGAVVRHLRDCEITFHDGEAALHQFRLE